MLYSSVPEVLNSSPGLIQLICQHFVFVSPCWNCVGCWQVSTQMLIICRFERIYEQSLSTCFVPATKVTKTSALSHRIVIKKFIFVVTNLCNQEVTFTSTRNSYTSCVSGHRSRYREVEALIHSARLLLRLTTNVRLRKRAVRRTTRQDKLFSLSRLTESSTQLSGTISVIHFYWGSLQCLSFYWCFVKRA